MKIIKMVVVLLVLCSFVYSADTPTNLKKHNVGYTINATPSTGFSYRYWGDNSFGFECFGVPVIKPNKRIISFGASGLKSINRSEYSNIFVYTKFDYRGDYKKSEYDEYDVIDKENIYGLGIGPGLELGWNMITVSFKLGYQILYSTKFYQNKYSDIREDDKYINSSFDVGISVFYSFGDF